MRQLFILLACALPLLVKAAEFQPGQVWSYHTRAGESNSTLTVLKVEQYKDLGRVVHIRIDGIQMRNPVKGNTLSDIPHLPFQDQALQKSVVQLLRKSASIPNFKEGYDIWKGAYLAGHAGAFDANVSDTLNFLLGAKWTEKVMFDFMEEGK